jgi:hypothetical protein
MLTRGQFVEAIGAAGAVAATTGALRAQTPQPQAPPSTVTIPPRDSGPNAPSTTYFIDPDVLAVDPLFGRYIQANSAITRLRTGALWCERPAWSGQGRYLVWSDNGGVTVWTPQGKLVGRIRLPEVCGKRQPVLPRAEAKPPLHGGEPVALRGLQQHPGCGARLVRPKQDRVGTLFIS